MSINQCLYHLLSRRPQRAVAAPAYDLLIALELAGQRVMDQLANRPTSQADLTPLTAVIKTFERPRILRRLLASVDRLYPQLKVIVVDDSRNARPVEGIETIILPFDSGLSAGRQAGLERVTTPYVLILDDDFIFYRYTDLGSALAIMNQQPDIDIMGGDVIYLPGFTSYDYSEIAVPNLGQQAARPPGSTIAGLQVLDKVPNFFIARTERLKLVGWQSELKLIEHGDFFARARGILTTVFNPNLKCLHAQTPFDLNYRQYRDSYLIETAILQYRYHKTRKP
jgi:glycosyltransferase involved in cell wall biosynthesis